MNKSKETSIFGQATIFILMMMIDNDFLTGSNLNVTVTRFKTESISLAREKSFSVENLL